MVIITGKMIRELREEREISQQKLAKAVGISQAHVAIIENEKVNPTLSTVNKIMSILKGNHHIKCKKVMKRNIISVTSKKKIPDAIRLMNNFEISQIPVIERGICLGSITEKGIINNMGKNLRKMTVRDIMERPFPIISSDGSLDVAKPLLEYSHAVLLSEERKIVGIITKSDILTLMR